MIILYYVHKHNKKFDFFSGKFWLGYFLHPLQRVENNLSLTFGEIFNNFIIDFILLLCII